MASLLKLTLPIGCIIILLTTVSHSLPNTAQTCLADSRSMASDIDGYDAKLQLFEKDGFTGARLYIKKTFTNWKTIFTSSWIGFYQTDMEPDNEYKAWSWAKDFISECFTDDSFIFSFTSTMNFQSLAQARFFLDGGYDGVRARTQLEIPPCPEMDNGNMRVDISGHSAKLQLFANNSFTGARLYIKKTFTNWKTIFTSSRIGFYQTDMEPDNEYKAWSWAKDFIRECFTDDSFIFSFTSTMNFQSLAQARFFMDGVIVRTQLEVPPCPEMDNGNMRVDISGHSAKLQLFANNGFTGARLYIKKTFTYWKSTFASSWVGIYLSDEKPDTEYTSWSWAKDFISECFTDDSFIFSFTSTMNFQSLAQARFFLDGGYDQVRARTQLEIPPCPEMDNGNMRVDISGHSAKLQLFANNSFTGARLYIKKTFTNWKTIFTSSRIGFYQTDMEPDNEYKAWSWAKDFIRECFTDDSFIFSFTSTMNFQSLAQARFFMDGVIVRTQLEVPPCPEMDNGNMRVDISGHSAKLQLFANNGFTGARLYIKKTFTYWKSTFASSWVGIYLSDEKPDTEYTSWNWAKDFTKQCSTDQYDMYSFQSTITNKSQARFFLDGGFDHVLARTEQRVPACPEMDNINVAVNISGYDAKLQLFAEGDLTGAHLYIKKTFTNWKNTFASSWVGFYQSDEKPDTESKDAKSTKDFTRQCSTDDSMVYSYTSTMQIQSQAQARFFLNGGYQPILARTATYQDGADQELPTCPGTVGIHGYDAKLQLFGQDGFAGAQLYIKKTFTDWETIFDKAYVGFYTSDKKTDIDRQDYRWAKEFTKRASTSHYNIYSHMSTMNIASLAQARFFLNGDSNLPIARTTTFQNSCPETED